MPDDPLEPLLNPRSIALVGASARPQSNGHALVRMARVDGYDGQLYAVNPKYQDIDGVSCYPDLASLPERVDHAVLAVPNQALEATLDQAISHGARAATIFATCQLEEEAAPTLAQRLSAKARAAGIAVCGGNCMGFYNPAAGLRVVSFPAPEGLRQGGIAWIAQSGSAFAALANNDRRIGFSLCVSTGMELVTSVADYVKWALRQDDTRVIGIFLESVRDPAGFVEALAQAADKGVPVIVLKVGRTQKSAEMARSHTGALAGDYTAFSALCRRYGVLQVDDLDELVATLALLDSPKRAQKGRLATIHDSGGEREMVVDLAEAWQVPMAAINEETKDKIKPHLELGLTAENPLDVYGTNRNYVERFAAATLALMADPDVALGIFMSDPRDGYWYASGYTDAVLKAAAATEKPLAMASNYSLTHDRETAERLRAGGVTLIKGTRSALLAAKHALAWRDFQGRNRVLPSGSDFPNKKWHKALADARQLHEHEGLAMLEDYGMAVPRRRLVGSREELRTAAKALRFPLVVKTAEGHAHKSDVGGVKTGLRDTEALLSAYEDMAGRLGPAALVMETAPSGVELNLGALVDPAFGPVVVVAAGGVLVEILDDKAAALAPFGADQAHRLLGELKIRQLFDGVRGRPPVDRPSLAEALSQFSVMVADLADVLCEIDVNPLIAGPDGVMAVDCLVMAQPRDDDA